ncbi:MAG: helix-turn-helix domain-containing protein, partial [Parvularculaceae bacterium]|nr:helix-turn-helix domain-containing protein [Parvularculaceae bacterium]
MTDASFASLLRARRAAAQATQREYADALGISQALLSQWETGAALPRAQR